MLKALSLLNALLGLLLLKRGFADKPETRVSFFSIGFIFKLAGVGIITLGGLIGLELTELTGLKRGFTNKLEAEQQLELEGETKIR